MSRTKTAGTNETKYFLKHGNDLNPLASKQNNMEDQNLPKWDNTAQRLVDSDVVEQVDDSDPTDVKKNLLIDEDLVVTGTTQHNGNVTLGTASEKVDLEINGDIIQNGSSYETHAEQIYTKKDHIILREGAVAGLLNGDHSGLLITKYDGTNNIHLCVENDGFARVGETDANGDELSATKTYTFTDSELYKDTNDDYFDDKKFTKPHEFYIPSEATNVTYTENAPEVTWKAVTVNDAASAVGLYETTSSPDPVDATRAEELTYPCTLYKRKVAKTVSVTITYQLTETSLQKLLTVEDSPEDQSLLYYDSKFNEARTIEKPATQDTPLVPVLDGGRVTYREYSGGGSGEGNANNWSGTKAEYETAMALTEDDDGYIADRSGVDILDVTAADLDIATAVREGDNQPVTSGAVYDYAESIKKYIRDQEYLEVTDVTESLPYTAPYDGYVYFRIRNSLPSNNVSSVDLLLSGKTAFAANSSNGANTSGVLAVRKGDIVRTGYIEGFNAPQIVRTRYYTKRDYSDR